MKARGAAAALALIEPLADKLASYFYFHGARGAFLKELGRTEDAIVAFDRAIAFANTPAEAAHFRQQIDRLDSHAARVRQKNEIFIDALSEPQTVVRPWSRRPRTHRSAKAQQPDPKGQPMSKNTICIWYDKDAEAAARFYATTFPDSVVAAVHLAPSDYPSGKAGDVLTVEFTVAGIPCLGINGGPMFKHSEAFSFQIATEDQAETDRYWSAIVGNGGQESQCGWCKDRWGVNWQITPRVLTEAIAAGGGEAKRAFAAMMGMKKINVAAIQAARRG